MEVTKGNEMLAVNCTAGKEGRERWMDGRTDGRKEEAAESTLLPEFIRFSVRSSFSPLSYIFDGSVTLAAGGAAPAARTSGFGMCVCVCQGGIAIDELNTQRRRRCRRVLHQEVNGGRKRSNWFK